MSGQLQNGEQQFIDANGKPLDGGTVDFYIPNTTTRKNTWQDQALTILNTNPVVLDAAGRAVIWGTGSYRQILKDKHGNLVWDKVVSDPITSLSATSGASLVGADDGVGGSIFTTVAGFISSLKSSIGSSLVGFIQAGTNAVSRLAQDKMRESVSVLDFGAIGDGVTDDTNAVQIALNYIASKGGTLRFPSGTYSVTGLSLAATSSLTPFQLIGDGTRNTFIKKRGTSLAAILQLSTAANLLETYYKIADISLLGNVGASNHNGFDLTNYARFTFERVEARDCYIGVNGKGLLVGSFYDSTFKDNQFNILTRKSTDNIYSNAVNFFGCVIVGANQWGIDAGQGSGLRFVGCDIEANGQTGVTATGAFISRSNLADEFGLSAISFSDCWFEGNRGTTIYSEPSTAAVRLSFDNIHILSSDGGRAMTLDGGHTVHLSNILAPSPADTITISASVSALAILDSTITNVVNNCPNYTYRNLTSISGLTRFKTAGPAGAYFIDATGHQFFGPVLVNNVPNLAKLAVSANGATENAFVCLNTDTGSANQQYIQFKRGSGTGTLTGSISNTATTTSYNTSSDYRLKENVQPMVGALASIMSLKPVTYTWLTDGTSGEGFIAHELAEICPLAVTGEKDGVDADGRPEYQGIDTSHLVGRLVAALQELKREFDAYKASRP